LRLDETIMTETPPLSYGYGRIGAPVCVPMTGSHARRVIHGVLNVRSGEVLLLITDAWVQEPHQAFLRLLRTHWRGWHIVLVEDRGSPHTAEESGELARALGLEVRFLPIATPELNAMDHLGRPVTGRALANRATPSIDVSADHACQYILAMSRHERLRKAGVLSGNFWLTN
jgi:hypothetical protein